MLIPSLFWTESDGILYVVFTMEYPIGDMERLHQEPVMVIDGMLDGFMIGGGMNHPLQQ